MGISDKLKQKIDALDEKVKARLEVHEMDPELKKKYKIRKDFRAVGDHIDESIEMIERMKTKIDKMEEKNKTSNND